MIANVLVKNAWYVAGLSGEFRPGELVGQVVAEKPLVLWRTPAGKAVAFDERCCHKRMPLSEGRFIEGDLLECAYHGLCYDATGQCVRVPSHPDGHIPPRAKLRSVAGHRAGRAGLGLARRSGESRRDDAAAAAGDRRATRGKLPMSKGRCAVPPIPCC